MIIKAFFSILSDQNEESLWGSPFYRIKDARGILNPTIHITKACSGGFCFVSPFLLEQRIKLIAM